MKMAMSVTPTKFGGTACLRFASACLRFGQRVLLDTQLLQHLAVVPHTVLALLFNLLLALNQQDQLVFIARLSSIKWGVRTG